MRSIFEISYLAHKLGVVLTFWFAVLVVDLLNAPKLLWFSEISLLIKHEALVNNSSYTRSLCSCFLLCLLFLSSGFFYIYLLDVKNYFSNMFSPTWNFRAVPNLIVSSKKIDIQPTTGVDGSFEKTTCSKRAPFYRTPRGSCRDRLVSLLINSSCLHKLRGINI